MTHAAVEKELARVLGYYALGELRAARRTEHGFVNENWIVETDRGRYFLKRRHPDLRRPDLIRAQHGLIERLRQASFPAPTVCARLRPRVRLFWCWTASSTRSTSTLRASPTTMTGRRTW